MASSHASHGRSVSVSTAVNNTTRPRARGSNSHVHPEISFGRHSMQGWNDKEDTDFDHQWDQTFEDHDGHIRRPSSAFSEADVAHKQEDPQPVTWMTLPHKRQLAILGLCRVFDFLQITSLQAYMFYQLRSFDEGQSDSVISTQAGLLQGAFTAAQFATAVPWGRVADAPWGGRKFVLMVGLLGTAVSCLGVAFSTTFAQAMVWRSFGGAINGMVGIIRTMIAENIKEKKYQSRAFLILPIGFNIASLFGPVMGGLLADPVRAYPRLFGPNSTFGGADGVGWLIKYPYSLPMILNAIFLSFCASVVSFGLEETLQSSKQRSNILTVLFKLILRAFCSIFSRPAPPRLPTQDSQTSDDLESLLNAETREPEQVEEQIAKEHDVSRTKLVLPFRRIWTSNVLFTLLAQAFFDFQMGAFNNLWLLFLSTPRYDPSDESAPQQRLPFVFTGGLGMPPQSVGFATAILGVIGMILQFSIYPAINSRLGTVKSYQFFLSLFPLAYALAPFISLSPSSSPPPAQATGWAVWISIVIVLILQVTARTFTLPTSIILLNNCSPHPSVLGTVHGIGQSVSSAFRTIGPVFAGSWYGYGIEIGMVGFAWWLIAGVSILGCLAALWVYEGSGHEILLPGEEEEEHIPLQRIR